MKTTTKPVDRPAYDNAQEEKIIKLQIDPKHDPSIEVPIPRKTGVVVIKLSSESIEEGNIIIPEASNQKGNIGTIYAVGRSADKDLMPGQRVLYNYYADTEIIFKGRSFIIMDDVDIKCHLPLNSYVNNRPDTAGVKQRKKRVKEEIDYKDRIFKKEQNELDKMTSKKMTATKVRRKKK